MAAVRGKPQARWDSRCPSCQAPQGAPCRNREGAVLDGPHFQRLSSKRRAVQAALSFYAGMGLRTKARP
jgi:hypothetical protein